MTKIYNKTSEKEKRRLLRKNSTSAEIFLWLELKNKKMCGLRFLRQYSIGPYVVDFYTPPIKLAIEVDGPAHLSEDEIEYDRERQTAIESLGVSFLRFTNAEIYDDRHNVLEKIKDTIQNMLLQSKPRSSKNTRISASH